MLSRPNIVMNHGSPAAGRLLPPAIGGEKRRAARSTRLRRYVAFSGAESHSRRGASSIHRSRLRSMFGLARFGRRPYFGWLNVPPPPPRDVTTSRSVVQLPCGSIRTAKVKPVLVDAGRRRGGDDRLALERLAGVLQEQPAVLDPRGVAPDLLERVLDLEQVGEVAGGVDPDRELDRLVLVVEDRQLLVEPVADRALAG